MVSDNGLHTHDDKVDNMSVVRIRADCKRKAIENIMERPAKLIRTAVQKQDDDDDSEITVNDVTDNVENVWSTIENTATNH